MGSGNKGAMLSQKLKVWLKVITQSNRVNAGKKGVGETFHLESHWERGNGGQG